MRSNPRRDSRIRQVPLCCSFCGKATHEVRHMVAGPQVFICNECVTEAQRIIAKMDIDAAIKPSLVASANS